MDRPDRTVSLSYLRRFHTSLTIQKVSDWNNFITAQTARHTVQINKGRKTKRKRAESVIEFDDLTDWYFKHSVLSVFDSESSETAPERIISPDIKDAEKQVMENLEQIRAIEEEPQIQNGNGIIETISGKNTFDDQNANLQGLKLVNDQMDQDLGPFLSDKDKEEIVADMPDPGIVGTMFLGEMLNAQMNEAHTSALDEIKVRSQSTAMTSKPSNDNMAELNWPFRFIFHLLTFFFVGRLILILLLSKIKRVIL